MSTRAITRWLVGGLGLTWLALSQVPALCAAPPPAPGPRSPAVPRENRVMGAADDDGPVSRMGLRPLGRWMSIGARGRGGHEEARDEREIGIPAGGDDVEAPVGASRLTRWEAAKRTLQQLLRAYVFQDVSSFMKVFSDGFLQDPGVFRNAILDDFQNELQPNIDVELLAYRITFEGILLRLRWNRSSVSREGGRPVNVSEGHSTLLFDRAGGFRLKAWYGTAPFGIRDPQLQQQLRAGQVRFPRAQVITVQLRDPGKDGLLLDVDTGAWRVFDASGNPDRRPTDDLLLEFVASGPTLALGSAHGRDGPPLGFCEQASELAELRAVIPENLLPRVTQLDGESVSELLALETTSGAYALLQVDASMSGATATVTVRWMIGEAPLVQSTGSVDCPLAGGTPTRILPGGGTEQVLTSP